MIVSSLAVHVGDRTYVQRRCANAGQTLRAHWLWMGLKEYSSLDPSHYCVEVTALENATEPFQYKDTLMIH